MYPEIGAPPQFDERRMRRVALICWGLALAVVAGRVLASRPGCHSVFFIFGAAGRHWIEGSRLYGLDDSVFRYSPTVAAFFAPWSLPPERPAEIAWRLLSTATWIWSLIYFFRVCVPTLGAGARWAAVLGSLPFAMSSLNNGQANLLTGAFLFASYADSASGRWNRCAVLLAAAVLFKLWPIAAVGLLIVVFPRQLGLRFALALAAGLAAPFLFQRWDYVAGSYREWALFLSQDLRTDYNLLEGYRDFWLLNRLVGAPLTLLQYQILQVGSGLALAAAVAWMGWRDRTATERLRFIATAGTCWMLGFGPATESSTYTLLSPLLAWTLLDPSRTGESYAERVLLLLCVTCFTIVLVSTALSNSLFVSAVGFQPVGTAALLARMAIGWRPIREPTPPMLNPPMRLAA